METKQKLTKSEEAKQRKRDSRSKESCMTNSLVLIFMTHLNATLTFRKTKKSSATVKMYLPVNINLNGGQHDQISLCKYSDIFMRETMKEEPIDITTMDDKQYNRSKEAQISNGLLYLLQQYGFTFVIKHTKKSTVTEKLVKISKLITPTNQEYSFDLLATIGYDFSKFMKDIFGREQLINLSKENIPIELYSQMINDDTCINGMKNVGDSVSYTTTNSGTIIQMNPIDHQSLQQMNSYSIQQQQIQMPNTEIGFDNEEQQNCYYYTNTPTYCLNHYYYNENGQLCVQNYSNCFM